VLSALTLLVWHKEEDLACTKLSDELLAEYLSEARCKWLVLWSSWWQCHPIISSL